MDFYQIKEREAGSSKKPVLEVYPDFRVTRSKDLMVRGRSFYAIWDEEKGLWSTDEYDVQRLVDEDLQRYVPKNENGIEQVKKKYLGSFTSNAWLQFRSYIGHLSDSSIQLDEKFTFSNTEVRKEDYVSRRLPYPLEPGSIDAYDELISTLYSPQERAKLEWSIGAVLSGDARTIQKFIVLYGSGGTGKSTVLEIIQWLTEGYYTTFEAKALTSNSNAFSTEAFKDNPLVAIQHDGDLSRIEDNTKLNSIVSHEYMTVNEKFKPSYMTRVNAFLYMGTNKPVKITDAKSGIIRRLIDVRPTGELIAPRRYQTLMSQIRFELGAIAHHCLTTYREMGRDYYSGYRPVEMMLQTDVFFNYIESYYDIFKHQDGTTLKQAYTLYKEFCDETHVEYKMAQYRFREELKNYFDEFHDTYELNGEKVRSYYSGFNADHFKTKQGGNKPEEETVYSLVLDETVSLVDRMLEDSPAQYSKEDGTPQKYWTAKERIGTDGKPFTPSAKNVVSTTLKDLDTSLEHYVKPPVNHIVIDFDLKDANGEKSAQRNLEAASSWPPTYAEYSKSGQGIHLHYIYKGNAEELSSVYDDGIEVKVFTGNSSLRRRLSRCNAIPVADLSPGVLPLKEKKVINSDTVKSEKALRDLIERNLRKEIHPGTKPSMDFIRKILDDAYASGLSYDVSDMRPRLQQFANRSTNQAPYCLKLLQVLRLQSEDKILEAVDMPKDERLVFFDVEVYPNLFYICWKYQDKIDSFGVRHKSDVVHMVNPKPEDVEPLLGMKLVGFNCRRYDNHILYARYMGYSNEQLFKLSQKIISGAKNAFFGKAYNISYTDILDFSSKKQSLKKFQIELGIHHMELSIPWDEPVPENRVGEVGLYCENDVISTEATFESRKQDFVARMILTDLSGLTPNHTTQQHAAKIIFGDDPRPQEKFIYTELNKEFPGYEYDYGKSTYRGEVTGEGGYVYAEPGMYENVAVLDITSMHPTTIEQLDLFGPYTQNFSALKAARVAIKRGELDDARKMFGGKLAPHLSEGEAAEALSYALKIVINIVYGLTSASFDNMFRDPRNIDNIVAKRGALFMIELKNYVQELGYQVVHIKTDSIKIPNADEKIIDLIMEFGDRYGYEFEHESTFDRFCLVNDAVYIAKTRAGRKPAHWEAVGAQFQHPYVFKKCFTREPITFEDMCEAKSVTTAMWLDFSKEEDLPMVFSDGESKMRHVGKTGLFCPVKDGGELLRAKDDKFYAVSGTKGFKWMESEMVKNLGKEKDIDRSYFDQMVDKAIETINKFGDYEQFVAE